MGPPVGGVWVVAGSSPAQSESVGCTGSVEFLKGILHGYRIAGERCSPTQGARTAVGNASDPHSGDKRASSDRPILNLQSTGRDDLCITPAGHGCRSHHLERPYLLTFERGTEGDPVG